MINVISDDELSKYIPLYGDRVRVRNFSKKKEKEAKLDEKKNSLLSVLKRKVEDRRKGKQFSYKPLINASDEESMRPRTSKKLVGNTNARKKSRLIELGWIYRDKNKDIQVKKRKGGGTRGVRVLRSYTKLDLIEEGKRLFFPNGVSGKGLVQDFDFDILDFKDMIVHDGVTVGEIYDDTKIPLLRFYLVTKPKSSSTYPTDETSSITLEDSETEEQRVPDNPVKRFRRTIGQQPPKDLLSQAMDICGIDCEDADVTIIDDVETGSTRTPVTKELQVHTTSSPVTTESHVLSTSSPVKTESHVLSTSSPVTTESHVLSTSTPATTESRVQTQEATFRFPESDFDEQPGAQSVPERNIKVHRGLVLKELIAAFSDINPESDVINIQVVLPNGQTEAAEDGGGVTRDILCEFWNAFYEESTLGNNFKVPFLRHDYGKKEWQSIANIIVFGWRTVGYFPIQMSDVFMQHCLYGVHKSDITTSFLMYLPENDSNILKSALDNFDSVEMDELLDVLQDHAVKTMPKRNNLKQIVEEIGHKELIQVPMYVIDCWYPILKRMTGINEEKLDSLYKNLLPTNRKALNILKFPEILSADENQVSNHLRRFVRELDPCTLRKFLRFCTGSDLLINNSVEIAFVNVTGLARRPMAHTCSCLLELPKFYENFPQFRKEFLSVLNANIWVMEII